MKPTEKQRKTVQRWINKWRPRLFLGEWNLDVRYAIENDPDTPDLYADIAVSTKYIEATITIYPVFWEQGSMRQQEVLVHELAHCITDKAYRNCTDLLNGNHVTPKQANYDWEQLTQRVANVALNSEWNS